MTEPTEGEVTRILRILAEKHGDRAEATDRLFEAAYGELRRIASALMRHEPRERTLEPTGLVNEAYLRLVGRRPIDWQSRAHFFGIVATAMRRVLVEHARQRRAEKRGGGWERIQLDEELHLTERSELEILEVDDALTRLAAMDPRGARVVELRIFTGLKEKEIAEVLGISERSVQADWRVAAMWLRHELEEPAAPS
ncbi:MAG: ECF-type sigma factor [Candidatus Eisenbacteria bacterium]